VLLPIPSTWTIDRPGNRPERMVYMNFGLDFFKILNVVIQVLRIFAKVFGDDTTKEKALESEERSREQNGDAC